MSIPWTVTDIWSLPGEAAGIRIMRNPLFMVYDRFVMGISVIQRLWRPNAGRRERLSVVYTDLVLLALLLILGRWLGYLEILGSASDDYGAGFVRRGMLFYVQHQFEGVLERKDRWSFVRADYRAVLLASCSHLKLVQR